MRQTIIIIISILTLGVFFLLMLAGMSTGPRGGDTRFSREHITYSSRDKAPYGSYVPYKLLENFFDNNKAKTITKPFAQTYRKDENFQTSSNDVYIIVAGKLYATQEDVDAMHQYVSAGNKLFMVIEEPDSLLEAAFNFSTTLRWKRNIDSILEQPGDTIVKYIHDLPLFAAQSFANPAFAPDTFFSAKGIAMVTGLDKTDTATTTILGTNAWHEPNFFRMNVGNGQLFVLLNPMTWTNNFLLEKQNIKALENQMAYLPRYPQNVYWDEFYKHLKYRQRGDFSNWQVLMRHPALRWALWLAVLLLLLYVLFEGKRRQRLIPPKPVLANTSLEFAETLGRLYYLHHNNRNLSQKMIQHLLEYIRNHYYLNTGQLNDEFVVLLSRKSGHPQEAVAAMITQIHALRMVDNVSDTELQNFYNSIYQFYLKAN
ncbi:DUF4350 domain-containing protein [Chitinophaga sp. SYP-B3965]|uniref:DUF4350 domain-containing protein n=1 Tax=Chitinophaga sp. SYP-B3965 TaxID=2663120 RepID=UPI001299E4CD|nr:DUF4350 domain-containing protein [Chitinophaga sp. SYP-B3965]MRG46719.1 DUF4350 domain-containing protein [Chitinophaga sp. SYP-B3965]